VGGEITPDSGAGGGAEAATAAAHVVDANKAAFPSPRQPEPPRAAADQPIPPAGKLQRGGEGQWPRQRQCRQGRCSLAGSAVARSGGAGGCGTGGARCGRGVAQTAVHDRVTAAHLHASPPQPPLGGDFLPPPPQRCHHVGRL